MTSKDIFQNLKKNFWANKLSSKDFPFISKMSTPPVFLIKKEVTVRIPTEEKTRFGKDKPQRRRFDGVGLVKPYYSAWGNELFTVGFEIKVSKSDLNGDEKFVDYLGFTDYFFFAVPSNLVIDALTKANDDRVGVIDAEKGEIVKMPIKQEIDVINSERLFRQLLFSF